MGDMEGLAISKGGDLMFLWYGKDGDFCCFRSQERNNIIPTIDREMKLKRVLKRLVYTEEKRER